MTKTIVTLLLVLAVFMVSPVKASAESKTMVLPEILKPVLMTFHDNHLYVLQDTSIYIYSVKDLKLVKKFGRQGEGPKEFMARPFGPPMTMSFSNGELVVNSNNKLSYFTPKGDYLREMKAPANTVFYQFKKNFIAVGPVMDDKQNFFITFRFMANDFKTKSTLVTTDLNLNNSSTVIMPIGPFAYNPVYKDKVVLAPDSEKFIIDIYDVNGKLERRLEKNFEKISIDDKYRKDIHSWFKNESP
ncbi:MAG: hypothetical protein GY765_43510, partial [bacterium]|nr:hypothetical protein [bacterium]